VVSAGRQFAASSESIELCVAALSTTAFFYQYRRFSAVVWHAFEVLGRADFRVREVEARLAAAKSRPHLVN